MKLMKLFAIVLGFALMAVAPVSAQCGIDDGLAGPCCTPANPNLPIFPALQTTGRGGVIRDCNVEAQFPTGTVVTNFPIIDDYYLMQISINGGGVVINNATFFAKYSRTWMELSSAGVVQVWRFLVNGDVPYTVNAASVPGLPAPISAFPPFNLPVHFNGAVDYAMLCGTTNWNVAYWLTHGCPTEMHAPWSAVPIPAAVGWPRRVYHFAAPGNINYGVAGPGPIGFIGGEAVRTSAVNTAGTYQSSTEIPIFPGGNLNTGPAYCQCALGPGALRNTDQTMTGITGCVGAIFPFNTFPVPGILPTGMRATALGSHIGALAPGQFYPSIGTRVNHELAVLQYTPPCPQILPSFVHLYGGVATSGTSPIQSFTSVPPVAGVIAHQIDLGNMLVMGGGGWQIGFGALYISDLVWNFSIL